MDIRTEAVKDYLTQGIGYRELAKKYGVSQTTICKWVQIPHYP
jgi:transposase-like protein